MQRNPFAGELSPLLDLRGLSAPAPLEQALAAADALAPGDELELLTPHMPYPLILLLEERGYVVAAEPCADGSARVRMRRPGAR